LAVINALADDAAAKTQGKGFVPYRNSKLTRVLQQSLGAAHCRALSRLRRPGQACSERFLLPLVRFACARFDHNTQAADTPASFLAAAVARA
jgi:hypothetical protein